MKGLSLELRGNTEIRVRGWIEKTMQSNENEAYYNAGADEMLEILACFWLSRLEQEKECLKIRETIINDEFEDNAKDYLKATQSFNIMAQEFFKLGFKTGFKLAIESDRNTLCVPALQQEFLNDDENETDEKQEKSLINLASKVGVTTEYMRNLLNQHIISQDCLDSPIQDQIVLEKYENEPYYDILYEVFSKTSHAYFELGFDTRDLMLRQGVKN